MFLTYRNPVARYSISYPEGWALKGSGRDVSFSDKNNVVHIVVAQRGGSDAGERGGPSSRR